MTTERAALQIHPDKTGSLNYKTDGIFALLPLSSASCGMPWTTKKRSLGMSSGGQRYLWDISKIGFILEYWLIVVPVFYNDCDSHFNLLKEEKRQ